MKKVTFSQRLLVSGVIKTAKIIKNVYGPKSGVGIIEKDKGLLSTRDGAMICRELTFENPYENLGLQIVREGALKVENLVGDGTSTTILLTAGLVGEGYKNIVAGYHPEEICQTLIKSKDDIIKDILPLLKKEVSFKNLKNSIKTSVNGDTGIAELVSEALMKVGKGGVVAVQDGEKLEDCFEIQEGFEISSGYETASYLKNLDSEVYLEGAGILLLDDYLYKEEHIVPILENVSQFQRPLVVFSHGVTGEAQKIMVLNNKKDTVQSCAVRAEGNRFTYIEFLKDLKAFTGGIIVEPKLGMNLKDFNNDWFGFCRGIKILKNKSILQAYPENLTIENRVKEIEYERDNTPHDWDRDRASNRIARLTGGFGVLKVGGVTLGEKQERKGRIEDALLNGKSCVEGGLLPGGGAIIPLINLILDDYGIGTTILKNSLIKLFNSIYRDDGYMYTSLLEFQKENIKKDPEEYTFDYRTGVINSIKDLELYEPYNLFKYALEVSVANACQVLRSCATVCQ
jgi:chaperonin GroEL